ncbi:MAG: Hydrolase, alpha/beta fold family [Rhodanobacteraceae bacterium]|jgi:pimeloyl-ACP methyl ester carboxylesterase|nr:MAG: Hydrolase, alpha/beta fold family [Rhodanobacteraceae bacterium]
MEKIDPRGEAHLDTITARDGLPLTVETRGPADAPAVLFAHGFGQSRHAWVRAAEGLAAHGWHAVTFDARGHGDSGRLADGSYALEQFVDDLLTVARSLAAPPVLVGASMGGLLGLVAAGETRPDPFRALVLVDITPRWESEGVERMLGFMRAHPRGFASLDEAADAVAAYLPQRRRRKDRYELAQLLHRGDDGRLRWHWDPALLDTVAHEGERHQQRLLKAARNIDVPVLLVSGGRSDIVSDATVTEFLEAVPHARHVEIPHATHTLAGDDNAAFTAAIEPFLTTLDPDAVPAPPSRAATLRDLP